MAKNLGITFSLRALQIQQIQHESSDLHRDASGRE